MNTLLLHHRCRSSALIAGAVKAHESSVNYLAPQRALQLIELEREYYRNVQFRQE